MLEAQRAAMGVWRGGDWRVSEDVVESVVD
jgi:hypothetical protein